MNKVFARGYDGVRMEADCGAVVYNERVAGAIEKYKYLNKTCNQWGASMKYETL